MANHSFQNYDGWARYKTPATRAWATTGQTDVVADTKVSSNSLIDIMNTSAYVGPWYVTINPGVGFTVTSGNSETQTTTTYQYVIL